MTTNRATDQGTDVAEPKQRESWTILNTRVGRRVFLLFILSALIPVLGLSVVAYRNVNNHIRDLTDQRISDNAKAAGMALIERIMAADGQLLDRMEALESGAANFGEAPFPAASADANKEAWTGRFVTEVEREAVETSSNAGNPNGIDEDGWEWLRDGQPLLQLDRGSGGLLQARLARLSDSGENLFWAGLRTDSLVAAAELYAQTTWGTGICAAGMLGEILACEDALEDGFVDAVNAGELSRRGTLELDSDEGGYLLGYWMVFLDGAFGSEPIFMAVSESAEGLKAPAEAFTAAFLVAIALCLAVVVFFSTAVIRRSLQPLRELKDAAERIGSADYETRVSIDSGDEFEELGTAFNGMVERIGSQFSFITTIREVDDKLLSALDSTEVSKVALEAFGPALRASHAWLLLFDRPGGAEGGLLRLDQSGGLGSLGRVTLSPQETGELGGQVRILELPPEAVRSYLTPEHHEPGPAMALPIRSNGQLSAVVCLRLPGGIDREAAELARQIADQIGIGLANARLVEELDALSLSSIRALARTIDTSSPWTSGHSERVAQLGVAIGAAMNLTPHQLDEIHRGGLLHDIGKIGVPKEVLDKPGRLTDEEFDAMKAHPVIGVRILEPIRQFEPLLPLVRSHHEKLDGTGYPDGLKGDEIHLYAKILAVADVWDAITSDRPYRDGMPYEKALGVIREGAGNHFDPRCVSAFSVIARDWYQTPVEVGQDFIQSLEAGVLV